MSSSQKLLNGLTDLGIQKMQEHLDYYIELVNKGEKSFSEALEELVEIEKKNNQIRRDIANVKTANFPFIKLLLFLLNHLKMLQCLHNCSLLILRALWLPTIFIFR